MPPSNIGDKYLSLFKQLKNIDTKLQHLTITPRWRRDHYRWSTPKVNDNTGEEITSLLTKITTNTSIKSLYIDPLWLAPKYNQFLRMWYCEPFGNCNIPQVLDSNGQKRSSHPRRNVLLENPSRAVYIAKI